MDKAHNADDKAADKKQEDGLEAAISLLERDHDEVDHMFREYKKLMDLDAPAKARGALAARICVALTMHDDIESNIFYPAAREAMPEDAEECLDHAEVEHESLRNLIAKIQAAQPDDELFDAHVHVLAEYVKHHVCEEREDMFSELRQAEAKMKGVAEKMASARGEFEGYMHEKSPDYSDHAAMIKRAQGRKSAAPASSAARKRTSRSAARKTVSRSGSTKKRETEK